jgi:hypothetical protein
LRARQQLPALTSRLAPFPFPASCDTEAS